MTILFVILIMLVSAILGFFVLIQNPKGGGLSGTFGGVSSQFMGVKQTNDILDRGTWILATLVGVLSLLSTFFVSRGSSTSNNGRLQDIGNTPPVQQQPASKPAAPANTTRLPAAPASNSGK